MSKRVWMYTACLLMLVSSAQAQENLSLEDAVARSLENNFDIRVARLQQNIAENNNSWGQTSALPSVNASASYRLNISDQSENPTSFIQAKIQTEGVEYGADLSWTLFDGLGMFASKRQLELLEAQSEGNASLIIENTVQAVTLAYYDALIQQEKREVLKDVIALSRDQAQYARDQKALGASTTFEILQFESAIISDSSNYLLQDIAVRNTIRNLNLLMGESPDLEWVLTTELNPPVLSYDYDALWNEVKNSNQSLRNQMINRLLNEQEKRIAQAQLYPVLSFNAGISESDNQFEAGELAASGQTLNYFGSFALQFNLFNGGKTRRALKNAKINEEIALISLEEQQLSVQQDLQNAFDLYQAQSAIYRLNEQNVENQRRALKIAEDRYANRVINSFDYRAQQVSYLNAGIARAESLQNLLSTHTTLVRLRGGLVK